MAKQLIKITNSFNDTLYGYAWTVKDPKANVIIMTGMQETAERYDDFANFLNQNNYDVYCIDHYGQGLNIKDINLPGVWPISGFSKTVKTFGELENNLKKTGLPVYIFAHSMGSFMAQEFIQRFHERVSKVILCGTDYANPWVMGCAYLLSKHIVPNSKRDEPSKKMANLVTGAFAKAVPNAKTEFDWLSYNTANVEKYSKDPKCGFVATGGFYREFLKGMKRIGKKKFIRKIRQTVSIYIIAGKEDPVGHMGKGPTKLYKRYKRLGVTNIQLKLYDKMRHEILNENNNKVVYQDILEFLDK
ncbi:MAG: lysophospholipase [Bacilli bacterium]|nr:lysophospholipase [Bacilli bacterium]